MKILVTGAKGQLGTDVMAALAALAIPAVGMDVDSLDLTDAAAVQAQFAAEQPDAVIHCAAYTQVDAAESDRERCFAVNEGGTRNVAAACQACGARLVYTSTDYVFPGDGDRPFETGDPTGPVNVYGASKLAGERAAQTLCPETMIVRISWVFGKHGKNFIRTMLRLGETQPSVRVVSDQIGAPTYTKDLAPLLIALAQRGQPGVYHATNEGECSWAQLAAAVFRLKGMATVVEPIPTAAYPTPARRPLNSRLSKASLDAAGLARLPDWEDALARFLQDL